MRNTIETHRAAQEEKIRDVRLSFAETAGLGEIIAASAKVMEAAAGNFTAHRGMTGSWIASQPVLFQLLRQPRLTVDLTLHQLKKDRPYGMDVQSLIHLAKNNLLLLNFRDYDSQKDKDFSGIKDKIEENLGRIYDEAPDSIYYGSVVRRKIFNAVPGLPGNDYEKLHAAAMQDLAFAYACFDNFFEHPAVEEYNAHFRGEKPPLAATAWHWAYLNAVSGKIQATHSKIINSTDGGIVYRLYNDAASIGRDAVKNKGMYRTADLKAALLFAELAALLRMCHLNFTAPITASFGTTYNMTAGEFMQSDHLRIKNEERDPLYDDEYLRLLYEILTDARHAHVLGNTGRLSRDVALAVDENAIVSATEDDVKRIADAVLNNWDGIRSAYGMMPDFSEALAKDGMDFSGFNWHDELKEASESHREYLSQKNVIIRTLMREAWKGVSIAADDLAVGALSTVFDPHGSKILWKGIDLFVTELIEEYCAKIWNKASHGVIFQIHHYLKKT